MKTAEDVTCLDVTNPSPSFTLSPQPSSHSKTHTNSPITVHEQPQSIKAISDSILSNLVELVGDIV